MSDWSLRALFQSLHRKIDEELNIAREALRHPGTKGNTSETVWIGLLETYLPSRYRVCGAHIVDSEGNFSDQIDVVVFDRQYSPFIFDFLGARVVPAESVYAVFEAKQTINAANVSYAREKLRSVRRLHRTSVQIPTASGLAPAKDPEHILGGLLTFESEWAPPLGDPLLGSLLDAVTDEDRIDLGCVSSHGLIMINEEEGSYELPLSNTATTRFLLELIKRLQGKATVPMMDVDAYSRWLD